ncbi:MAG TPA: hypothetical protein VNN62_09340 [Methylomirabilota bacterium]|jgi:hypothetical protein|nr:hypothetical protein [Methylomirabilota bacterium]
MEDLIIDIIKDGRVLTLPEIPPVIAAEIEAAVARGEEPREILYEGATYCWFVRPCVYP